MANHPRARDAAPPPARSGPLTEAPLLRAERLSRTYVSRGETVHAVREATLTLEPGQIVLIQGKSGSGKTTLLNLMGGLDEPTTGRVWYRGRDIATLTGRERTLWHRGEVGFVFQAFALIPGLTALENVDLALRIAGRPAVEAEASALQALERVGLAKRAHHRTEELSGGEQQRVAIARGLVAEPRLLLADEPLGELDHATASRMLELLVAVAREGAAVCLTSHDPLVAEHCDDVYTLEDGSITWDRRRA